MFYLIQAKLIFQSPLAGWSMVQIQQSFQMRNDKYKAQPPKLKTIPRTFAISSINQLSSSQRSIVTEECDPIFMNKNKNAIDEASFRSKYERALELIDRRKESQSRSALNILQFLCSEIPKLPEVHELSNQLLETTVINCWRLKNSFKDADTKKQECLNFIRSFVQYFTEFYKRYQIHKNGLYMLYLIQATEQFDQKLFGDALKSCDMSIKYCSGVKNQAHLLKVQYLKWSIHNSLNNTREELESIKRCLFFINSLIATTNEENLKEYTNQLKKTLLARQIFLKEHPHQQKSIDIQKKTSFSMFRKRSLSQKKQQSQKEILPQKKDLSLKNSKRTLMKSIHTRTASHSKHSKLILTEERTTFLPVDLTKFNKPEQKLKKKPLKLQSRHRTNQSHERHSHIMDQIQQMAPPAFNFQLLLVRRPNEKKQSLKKTNKSAEIEEAINQQGSIREMSKKESIRDQLQEQKIEPVTHYIAKSMHTGSGHDEIIEQQHEELVRQCVKASQDSLLKTFFKKIALDEENQNNDKINSNSINFPSRLESSSSSSFSSSNQFKQQVQQIPELALSHSETKNHFDFFEPQLDCDSSVNLTENLQLVLYHGILSKFKFSIMIQKKQHENQVGQVYKQLYINFSAILNRREYLYSILTFRYYNPYEKNLQIIVDEICKNELDNIYTSGESIKFKLLNLLSNRLLLIKSPNGLNLVQKQESLFKKNDLAIQYTEYLRERFIIYEENKLTDFSMHKSLAQNSYVTKKNIADTLQHKSMQEEPANEKKDENFGFHQILNYYLPKLIRRMTDDLKEEKSSISSVKRMKTQKFYKDTILSYKSLIKSFNENDINAKVMFDDQKSLSIVMPSDFNVKISNFFENEEGVKETSIYQFYYCMKFILIQPSKSENYKQFQQLQQRRRTSSITIAIKDCDEMKGGKQFQQVKPPKFLENTLQNFYDFMEIKHLFYLKNKLKVHIKMTCYKVKEIFKKSQEYFYKFEMQFNGEKIKMMKFIATSYDIHLLINKKADQYRGKQSKLKSSKKLRDKSAKQDYDIPKFNEFSLLNLLKQISQRIFVKKDYIYSIIGIQNPKEHFNYINKFKLEGKTVQNKQFMIPHLKYIHILLQKSIKITCDQFKEFAVLTIRQIERSIEFNVFFYLPKYQRTFSIILNRNIIQYLLPEQQSFLFDGEIPPKGQKQKLLFKNHEDLPSRQIQTKLWNNFSKLFKFQAHNYEDKMHVLLKIGTFVAFMKDSCFSEYFQLKDKIFHLQISLTKKVSHSSSQFELKHVRNIHPKRKSASSKELIKRNNFMPSNMKSSARVFKPSIERKNIDQNQLFKKGELFEKLSKIYQTQTNKYVIYISLTKIYEIGNKQDSNEEMETKKINFSFYLSDMINLLKESKKELYTKQEKIYNEFNEEVFSFSILLRAMTIIKYKLINELKRFKEIDEIFEGENTIKIQKQFKNNLIKSFCSENQHLYSLNSSKKFYKYENNIYLINKNLMNAKKNIIVSIFYDEKGKKITFYLTNSNDFINKQKMYPIKDMKFPWIQFYQKQQLFKISTRMYKFYKNILLFT